MLLVAPDSEEDKRTGARTFTVKVRTDTEAVGGAVVGFFLGRGTVENTHRERRRAVEQAQAELDSWLRTRTEITRRPTCFAAAEDSTGEPDRENP